MIKYFIFFIIAISISSCDNANKDNTTNSKKKTTEVVEQNESDEDLTSDYGKKKIFNGTELYYTSSITSQEAEKMGDYLIESGFADGETKTVQINRVGNTYEFRMVVKKGIDQDQEYIDLGKQMAAEISQNVFNEKQVDVHYCDENLTTLRVMPMSNY